MLTLKILRAAGIKGLKRLFSQLSSLQRSDASRSIAAPALVSVVISLFLLLDDVRWMMGKANSHCMTIQRV